jgi:hypothetical protein
MNDAISPLPYVCTTDFYNVEILKIIDDINGKQWSLKQNGTFYFKMFFPL